MSLSDSCSRLSSVGEDSGRSRSGSLSLPARSPTLSDGSLSPPGGEGGAARQDRQLALGPFGWSVGREWRPLAPPLLSSCRGVYVALRPAAPEPAAAARPRGAQGCRRACGSQRASLPGSAPWAPERGGKVQRYGTPRLFPCSQVAGTRLTVRGHREFATMLHYDEEFRRSVGPEWRRFVVASPAIVEWVMGLPCGWSAAESLSSRAIADSLAACLMVAGVPAATGNRKKHRTLSLFSGCGALDFGLSCLCEPVAYCDACDAAAGVLRARQRDGSLRPGAMHKDIRSLSGADLRGKVDGIVAGFPCQDISFAGQQAGLRGQRSSLVFEALRLADETGCSFIFMENVANICKLPGVWQSLLDALGSRSFAVKWCVVEAAHVGAPQCRPRWFALARRGLASLRLSACPFPDGRIPDFAMHSGLRFNGGRPHPSLWLLPKEDWPRVAARLNMLGNAVVPLQAALAAKLLSL